MPGWESTPAVTGSQQQPFESLGIPGDMGFAGYYMFDQVGSLEECADKCLGNDLCAGFNWITSDSHSKKFPCQLGTVVDPTGFDGITTGCAFVKDPDTASDPTVIDCKVTANWNWGPCSSVCGEGKSTRTREVTVQPQNGGRACPLLTQSVDCMNRICDCNKVMCAYQTHRCGRTTHSYTGANVLSSYDSAGITGMGVGDQHGEMSAYDRHNGAQICDASESVKVYHDLAENGCVVDDESCAMTGHHCKVSENGRTQLHGKTGLAGGDAQRGEGATFVRHAVQYAPCVALHWMWGAWLWGAHQCYPHLDFPHASHFVPHGALKYVP
jgi:hypothetical protein